MPKWANDLFMDASLDYQAGCDNQAACSAQPLTYYEAKDHSAWPASSAVALGDAARPVTRNGYAYECTTAGTTGASEPTWPTTPGNTVADGTVVWTCRSNYALADVALVGGDFTKANGDTNGRKQTTGAKSSVSVHTSGTATHNAQVDDATKSLRYVTTCASQVLTAGNTVNFPAWDVEVSDPA